jgi:hypothetical protein
MLVEKFGILRWPQSATLKYAAKTVSVFIKLRNLGVYNGVYMVMLIGRDLRLHDSLFLARQDCVYINPST